MVDDWARAYRPARARWGVIAWEAAGLAYLHGTTVRLFDLDADGSIPLAVVLLLTWIAGSWQVVRMGVYLRAGAVRIRGVMRTRTIPFADIAEVSVEDVVHRVGPLRVPSGRTVFLVLRDGTRVNTAMWQRGLDFHHRPRLFREVCRELRDRVAPHPATALAPSPPARRRRG
ncbi:hypothetical protein BJY16_005411 [Actinoplanes octamycinicus]|uniref:PH (Pleckstrin Homology) domain-containing protein n=1 Tax=Actinoplanes octamycinicus TaxID=135948 RepID=A0A7W7H1E1_9ACTN|nr:PH domain-containing protein [Actinoplanes octamycinicus]MBB4741952.1 hypothetical protein [Actinoplanes octamycinicus]GIE60717.1 hypothetical protein Aoc01nite_61190 [Actinoplanes octamycinicus]